MNDYHITNPRNLVSKDGECAELSNTLRNLGTKFSYTKENNNNFLYVSLPDLSDTLRGQIERNVRAYYPVAAEKAFRAADRTVIYKLN